MYFQVGDVVAEIGGSSVRGLAFPRVAGLSLSLTLTLSFSLTHCLFLSRSLSRLPSIIRPYLSACLPKFRASPVPLHQLTKL